jgi:hypothetical protein
LFDWCLLLVFIGLFQLLQFANPARISRHRSIIWHLRINSWFLLLLSSDNSALLVLLFIRLLLARLRDRQLTKPFEERPSEPLRQLNVVVITVTAAAGSFTPGKLLEILRQLELDFPELALLESEFGFALFCVFDLEHFWGQFLLGEASFFAV